MGDRERRWAAVSVHRERLLRLARARVGNTHDAEDCVQEAMVRCVEFADLDEERLGQFLTSVTIRLCADVHRGQTRGAKLTRRLTSFVTDEPSPEESVCDRAESAWLSRRLDGLTPRQRAIVEARAEGLSCGAVAERLVIPYTTVESALARVRRTMRGALESTLGIAAVPSWLKVKRVLVGGLGATAAAITVTQFAPEPAPARPQALAPISVPADDVRDVPERRAVPAAPARASTRLATSLTPGAPTTVRAPGVTPGTTGRRGIDADGENLPVRITNDPQYTLSDRVDHCVENGYAVGDEYMGCRFPPDDPQSEQRETVGIPPPAPEGGNQ